MRNRIKSSILIFCVLGIFALRWYMALPKFDAGYAGSYRGQTFTMIAKVLEPTDTLDVTGFKRFGSVYPLIGRVRIPVNFAQDLDYGDIVEITGLLAEPLGSDPRVAAFISKPLIYSVKEGKGNRFYSFLLGLRKNLVERLNNVFPEPAASFASGLLLGVRSAIPKDILLDFKRTGLTHIIALSGFNIVILIGFVFAIFSRLRRRARTILSISIIIIFILLVGGGASIIRAGIMGSLSLIARIFGRRSSGLRALFITAYVMSLFDPFIIFYDIGFQLSFGATAGLIVFTDRFKRYFEPLPNWVGMKDNLVATTSAQVFTLPLIIFYFKGFSFIAPLVNIIVLPAIPWLMLGSFLSLVLGKTVAYPTFLLFQAIINTIHFFSGLPFVFADAGIS